jgi:nitrogen fixation protein FixH
VRRAKQQEWTGRTALFIILTFFGIVFAADGVFVYLATTSWTGLSTEDPYRKGLKYNQTIERAAAQQTLGWHTAVSLEPLDENQDRVTVTLRDKSDVPIENRVITATFRRPVTADQDIEIPLTWTGAGTYTADLALPFRGQWDVHVAVARNSDTPYSIEARVWRN